MEDKRNEIVKKGMELFLKYGIKSISMDEIARALGMSKKTLYKYIRDKHELVDLVVTKMLTMNKFHDSTVRTNLNAIEEYVSIHQQVVKYISYANFSAEFDLQKYYPDLYKKLNENRQAKMMKGMMMNLKKGIKEGLYRQDLDIDIIARLNVMLSEGMHDYDFLMKNRDRLIHFLDVSFDFYMHGIINEKGIKEYYKIKSAKHHENEN